MIKIWLKSALSVIIFVILAVSTACALTIRIPQSVNPAKVTILFGSYEHGLACWQVDTKSGVHDYKVDLKNARAKLVLYTPGYKAVYAEFQKGCDTEVFEPTFEMVPMVPVLIRLTYRDGKPIANKPAQVRLSLLSHEYFGYSDGMTYEIPMASPITDSKGEFVAWVPQLLDDPYFKKYSRETVGFDVWLNVPKSEIDGQLIPPKRLDSKRSYKGTVFFQFYRWASIHGQVRQSFLRRNNVQANARVSFVAKQGLSLSGPDLGVDGGFKMSIEPGTYNLSVLVGENEIYREIPVQNNIVLKDDEDHYVDIE